MSLSRLNSLLIMLIALLALLVISQPSIAQSANQAATLPAGVGEQPIVIRTNQPFANQIRSTLRPKPAQDQVQTDNQQSSSQPNNQAQPRQQQRVIYGQPRRMQNQFGTRQYYKPYKPSSLPHFQYRQNQEQGQFGTTNPVYKQRNSNVLRVDKDGRSVEAIKQASETGGQQTQTADGEKVIVAPVDTNRFNKDRFKTVPKYLRKHPSWQGGHYLHFPDQPPAPNQ